MGNQEERKRFVDQVRKACRIAKTLRERGVRPHGIVRIDSACSVTDWAHDPSGNQARIAQTFREACDVAAGFGERLAAEGEICWGGMQSWRTMLDLLQRVGRPKILGFQADMAHTLLYILGYNATEDAILPGDWDWADPARFDHALKTLTDALRPWTIDFHVAQNDATVKGSGTHDKTGHHCLPNDPNGKLSIARHAGFWLRGVNGQPAKAFQHICWDGCMFPNDVMGKAETWNNILRCMIAVRDAHGWTEPKPQLAVEESSVRIMSPAPQKRKPKTSRTRRRPSTRKSTAALRSMKKKTPSLPRRAKKSVKLNSRSRKTKAPKRGKLRKAGKRK
jgi:hypothetical protein